VEEDWWVFLDAGGVVLDESEHEVARGRAIVSVLRRIQPEYTLEDYRADCREAVAMYCPSVYRFVVWKHTRPDRLSFSRLYEEHLRIYRCQAPPLRLSTGIGEQLRLLHGIARIGLAGQYGGAVADLLREGGLAGLFSALHTHEQFPVTKPDPRFYERVLKLAGATAGRSVMVGDRVDKDVIPAKAVGMRTIRVRVGLHRHQEPRLPEEHPDAEIPEVGELADAVGSLAATASGR
jgi:FMN phosphatase YigB (HAD superfamily)